MCQWALAWALFRNPHDSNSVRHHAQYILREGSKDLGATTLEGSRNGMAMMVFSSLHILGREGYQLLIDRGIDMASEFAKMVDEHPDFELVTDPVLSIFTYRVRPRNLEMLSSFDENAQSTINHQLNTLTVAVQKQQREAGKSFVSRTRIDTESYPEQTITVFRVVLANPLTTKEDLSNILAEQLSIAKQKQIWHQLTDDGAEYKIA